MQREVLYQVERLRTGWGKIPYATATWRLLSTLPALSAPLQYKLPRATSAERQPSLSLDR